MNSGVFSTSRMLFGLSREDQGPKAFGKLNRRAVPANALYFSAACLLLGAALRILYQIQLKHLRLQQHFQRFSSSACGCLLSGVTSVITPRVLNCMPNQHLNCRVAYLHVGSRYFLYWYDLRIVFRARHF